MFVGSSSLATSRLLYHSLPYAISDLAPVTLVCTFPLLMVAPNSSPAKSVAAFIAFATKNKGKVTFASPGVGTVPHLAGELFKQITRMGRCPFWVNNGHRGSSAQGPLYPGSGH